MANQEEEKRRGRVLRERRQKFMRRSRAAVPVDPFAGQVSFESNFNGVNGSNAPYVTLTGQTFTFTGTATLDNTHADGGTAVNPGTSVVQSPFGSYCNLGEADSDPYTIEWSVYLNTLAKTSNFIQTNWSSQGILLRVDTSQLDFFWIDQSLGSRNISKAAAFPSAGVMYRMAITKDASRVWRLFRAGTKIHEATIAVGQAGVKNIASGFMFIGGNQNDFWLDRMRITLACRYTANYDANAVVFASD